MKPGNTTTPTRYSPVGGRGPIPGGAEVGTEEVVEGRINVVVVVVVVDAVVVGTTEEDLAVLLVLVVLEVLVVFDAIMMLDTSIFYMVGGFNIYSYL